MNRNLIGAIAALVGAIIGAGVLGIPYTFAKSGILLGLCNLIFVGLVILLMVLMLGEVTLRTRKSHMLPKLAEIFLGKRGKALIFVAMFAGVWGAMIAYLIGVGESLAAISGITTIFGLSSNLVFSLLFFVTASALVYFGLRTVTRSELILAGGTVLVILALCIWGLFKVSFSNLTTMSWGNIFLPYGVVLFAIMGSATIPEVRRILSDSKRKIKTALICGILIPLVLYAIFSIVVVGVTGAATTEIATIGLGDSLGVGAILLGNLFAILAMASSYVILGLALKDSLTDGIRGMKHWLAFLLAVCVPLVVFLLGVKSFIGVVGLTGAIAGGIEGIMIALMWRAARRKGNRKPDYTIKCGPVSYVLIGVFALGIVYTVLSVAGVL